VTDGTEESNLNLVTTDGVVAEKLAPAKKRHRRRQCRACTADDYNDENTK
jgi:hypothetical protein